jgi:hypothetical protein
MMPCMDSKTVKPSATLSTFISKEPSICESLARPILPHTGQRRPSTRSSRDAIPQICNLRLLRSMSYLAATIKFGKREFPSPPWNPRVKKIRPVGLLRGPIRAARGTSARCHLNSYSREHRRCQIAPLHINTIISPIPIRMFMPAIATPRKRSALMLSDWNLACLPRTAFPHAIVPPQ